MAARRIEPWASLYRSVISKHLTTAVAGTAAAVGAVAVAAAAANKAAAVAAAVVANGADAAVDAVSATNEINKSHLEAIFGTVNACDAFLFGEKFCAETASCGLVRRCQIIAERLA